MRLNHPFSVRLANGSEQTFATAEEMAKWIAQQRGLQMPAKTRRGNRRRSAKHQQVDRVMRLERSPNESPLDRFNRNSSYASAHWGNARRN